MQCHFDDEICGAAPAPREFFVLPDLTPNRMDRYRRGLSKILLVGGALLLAACGTVPPAEPPPPEPTPVETPAAETPPPVEPAPPAAPPAPLERPAPPAPVIPDQVAILLAGDTPAYRQVADKLSATLEDRESILLPLADERMVTDGLFRSLEADGVDAIVAIGLPAARAASRHARIPVIFCQVFDVENPDLMVDRVHGVSALPPLDRQLQEWLAIDPHLSSVGALLGAGQESLVAEAEAAAQGAGIRFQLRHATSDKEALYLFKRMAPDIDGLWLFPDSRILSPTVLREMLDFAVRRNIRVVVFSPALLRMGAFMSAGTVPDDIARVIVHILDSIADGDGATLPRVSPLTAVRISINPLTARRLGLEIPDSAWAGGSR